jgi:hypothetical protein
MKQEPNDDDQHDGDDYPQPAPRRTRLRHGHGARVRPVMKRHLPFPGAVAKNGT